MICPKCQTPALDSAFICENCNAILDTSFLGDDITNEADAPAAVANDQATRMKPAASIQPPPARAAARQGAEAAAAPAGELEALAARNARQKVSAFVEGAAPPKETAEAFDDLLAQYKAFGASEKLVAMCSLAVLASLVLPWQTMGKDGDYIGLLVDGGWLVGLVAVTSFASLFVRKLPALRPWKDRLLLANVGLSLLALGAGAFFLATVQVERDLRTGGRRYTEVLSSAHFGAYLGVAACVALLLATAKLYLDRHKLDD